MAFRHGVYTSEVPTSLLPAVSVDSNVVFAVGTAAIETLDDGSTKYINKPRCYYSYDEFVTEMGWNADRFSDYSLQELIYSHFALYRGAPVVAVNVFDPAKHQTQVSKTAVFEGGRLDLGHEFVMDVKISVGSSVVRTETQEVTAVTLTNGVVTLPHQNISEVEITLNEGETLLVEGQDYAVNLATGTVTRLANSQIPTASSTIYITYDYRVIVHTDDVKVEGIDYELNARTGIATRLAGGSLGEDAQVTVSFAYADVSKVTAADIIGGIDADGNSLGLELIDSVFPLYRLVPGSILCPKYGEDPAVAVTMAAKSHDINGLFNAIAIVDIPSDGTSGGLTKYTEVPAYKQNNNLVDEHLIVCWPKVKLGDNVYGLATHLTGLMSQTDNANGGVPYGSASNKGLNVTSIGLVDTDGSWKELSLGMEKVNYLNGEGIYSALNWTGGLRSWGGRMSCYPGNTDPKDCQEPIRRMFNWYRNTFILTYFQKVDAPMTKRLIQTILRSENIRLEGFTSREILLGGRITFDESKNPLTDLIDGIVRFHLYFTPPPAAREIDCTFEFDTDNLATLFS